MYTRELSAALALANDAAQLIMDVYATNFGVDYKSYGDPVTEADRRANEAIVRGLRVEFPDDGICSEEGNVVEGSAEAARGGRCWFVDPLDGTKEFVAKNGEFCVMIGLAVDGEAQLGVIVAPAWNRTLWGIVGQGARERRGDANERVIAVAEPPDDSRHVRMLVSRSHPHPCVAGVADGLGITDIRPCGSVGVKVARVAAGEADLYVHGGGGPKLWDGCAPEAIARAAGAKVTDGAGAMLRYDAARLPLDRGIVVASPRLHGLAVEAFCRSTT